MTDSNDHLRPAQQTPDRSALTQIAAECHRAKWQFDFNEEIKIGIGVARRLVTKSFDELHRIGDLALKLRDGAAQRPQGSSSGLDAIYDALGEIETDETGNCRWSDIANVQRAVYQMARDAEAQTASEPPPCGEGVAGFYGAQCPSYPACVGGCGLGCTYEIENARKARAHPAALPSRAEIIEQCATVADDQAKAWLSGPAATAIGQAYQNACHSVAKAIRALQEGK